MAKAKTGIYAIKTSTGSVRKYPNVIWFPRSKTDPREIREVLKIALKTQKENPEGYFNDKLLGTKMAQMGSISVVGLDGTAYVESYKNKSIGDVSFITNARMLMRLFRFLGFVRRIGTGKYILTDLGVMYCGFSGDFPSHINGVSEEKVLLDSLANFSFYSVGDDSSYRDPKFRIRPFLWLLHNLAIEQQCIYQLIVTAFASRSENEAEEKRIRLLLKNLRNGSTTLKEEWKKVGLDPDDYSCVHNFYDSVKILVYLGISLGLIKKTSDPEYGKKITGKARNLKQATIFYCLTEKGQKVIEANLGNRLVYYDEIYKVFGDENVLPASFILASLNFRMGNIAVTRIHQNFFQIDQIEPILDRIQNSMGIEIDQEDGFVGLRKPISFSFFQQIPPEIMAQPLLEAGYNDLMADLTKGAKIETAEDVTYPTLENSHLAPFFELDSSRRLEISGSDYDLNDAIRYPGMDEVFGGKDRFSGRVSPTNSVVVERGKLYIDQDLDALDLLVPLRTKSEHVATFISKNINDLVDKFMERSDIWEKDQHYTWVRNVFRHFGMEALYSGSGGMLSRADVSVLNPFIAGIEIKSPRENRGTLNTKAIRQAVDAKIQVADQLKTKLPKSAIAVGRRISENAIKEERKWAKEGQPVLLVNDAILHYLVLKSASISLSPPSLISLFTTNHGPLSLEPIRKLLEDSGADLKAAESELSHLSTYLSVAGGEG